MGFMDEFKFWLEDDYFDQATKNELLAIRDDEKEIYLTIRKAKEGEEQKEIEGHYGYQYGETLIYHFE